MKQIEEIIRNTTEEEQEKVDWTKVWSTKYPVLATYQKKVDIPKKQPPVILYHGTGEKYVASIDEQGLIPKSRLYVHLSGDEATATIVGSRHGRSVVYEVLASQMYNDGYEFFQSVNEVWLTKSVPVQYLKKLK